MWIFVPQNMWILYHRICGSLYHRICGSLYHRICGSLYHRICGSLVIYLIAIMEYIANINMLCIQMQCSIQLWHVQKKNVHSLKIKNMFSQQEVPLIFAYDWLSWQHVHLFKIQQLITVMKSIQGILKRLLQIFLQNHENMFLLY